MGYRLDGERARIAATWEIVFEAGFNVTVNWDVAKESGPLGAEQRELIAYCRKYSGLKVSEWEAIFTGTDPDGDEVLDTAVLTTNVDFRGAEFAGVVLSMTLGGPTVRVDTYRGLVIAVSGSDVATAPLTGPVCEFINGAGE